MAADVKLTPRQIEALRAAYLATDGWLMRGHSRIWGLAPMAIMALGGKGLLHMPHGRGRARLTAEGRALIEADPARFGAAPIQGRG